MLTTKKGMSPLLATILLIAFAISLGALIMSLGRHIPTDETDYVNASKICSKVNFEVYKVGEKESICFDKEAGKINFIAVNRGSKSIDSMQIWVIGKRLYTKEILDNPLRPNIPIEKKIDYDASFYGTISEAQFIARVDDPELENPILCVDHPIVVKDIGEC